MKIKYSIRIKINNHKTANLIRNWAQNNNDIKQKDALKDEHLNDQINKKVSKF